MSRQTWNVRPETAQLMGLIVSIQSTRPGITNEEIVRILATIFIPEQLSTVVPPRQGR